MSEGSSGWRELQRQPRHRPASPKITTSFARLARVQVTSAAGDAMIAVALAGSLFFSIDPSAARWRVGLYLLFTVAPFAIVGPLIGPALDRARGGRRLMMILINAARAVACLLLISNIDSLLIFPLAFILLVMGKSFAVAKAALVPSTVSNHQELVDNNSRLALLAGMAGFAGAAPAALASVIAGPGAAVALATIAFAGAALFSLQLPNTAVAEAPADSTERLELRGSGIVLAGSAMAILRGIVGYMTFLVAFAFRGGADDVDLSGIGTAMGAGLRNKLGFEVGSDGGVPAWQLGVVVAFSVIGMLLGSLVAPRLRRSTPEENILLGVLVLAVGISLLSAWTGDLTAAVIVAMTIGLAASAGKLAFDSIVQRDAPDANYGRSFARFETRFQVAWVIGAIFPVIIKTPANIGFFVIGIAAAVAALSYFFGSRAAGETPTAEEVAAARDEEVELEEEDLRPAYPEMNLRQPSIPRVPTGWEVDSTTAPPAPPPPSSHSPTPPAVSDRPVSPTDATVVNVRPGVSDPTVVDRAGDATDPTFGQSTEANDGDEPELPLWPDR